MEEQLRLPIYEPWEDPSVPRWIRINRLIKAADKYADAQIVYTKSEFGPSLVKANKAKDDFVNARIYAAVWCGTIWIALGNAISDHEAKGEELAIPESCLAELTPKTRAQVCELLEAHWAALDELDEEETA